MANVILLFIAAIFMLLGLGSLIVGIVLPITLHNQLVDKGIGASRIEANVSGDVWANIPGDRGYMLTQEYEFFEILNPNDYKYGIQPQARSVGTIVLSETRKTITDITAYNVTTYDNRQEVMFDFTQSIDLEYIRGEDMLNQEIMSPNPEVYAQLAATRDATPWHVAIRALKQIVDFTIQEYRKRAIVGQMMLMNNSYKNRESFLTNRGSLFTNNGMTTQQVYNIFDDTHMGFSDIDNIRVWAESCDTSIDAFNRKVIMDFFDINSNAMNAFITQLCTDWDEARNTLDTATWVNSNCEAHGIFYKQWSNGTMSKTVFKKDSMNHLNHINGHPEMSVFLSQVFFVNLTDQIKSQFSGVDFMTRTTAFQFAKIFDPEDLGGSLYNFTNVKTLFEIGDKVDEKSSDAEIDVSKFEPLTKYMTTVEPREAYVIYRYLKHLAANTYLQGKTADIASFATITAPLFKKEIQNFTIDFGSEYIGQALFRYFSAETWVNAFQRIFPSKSGNANRVCASSKTALNTLDGLRFWMRLYIGRRKSDEAVLQDITSYTLADFASEFDDTSSVFHKHVGTIIDAIGMGRLQRNICNQDYNDLCSIYEIGLNQWLNSEFTLNLPTMFKGQFNEHHSWVDTFRPNDADTILKAEINYFIYLQPIFDEHNITIRNVFNEFRAHRIYEPLFFMSFLRDKNVVDTPFDDDVFISYVGVIYKNRNFPPLIVKRPIKDLLEDSESEYLVNLQRAPLIKNGNPLVRTHYQALRYPQLKNNIVHWQLLSGHMVEDYIRRVFTYNNTDFTYAVTNRTFWHENSNPRKSKLQEYTYQPWNDTVHLAFGSDSIQYEPNIGTKKDIAYYSPFLKAQIGLDYTDIGTVFNTRTYDYILDGNIFELSKPDARSNKYHNYLYPDSLNATEIFGSSLFITAPLYSNFGESMRPNACQLLRDGKRVEFKHENDTTIKIEMYSGIAMSSKQSYQFNYVFDTYSLGLDSFTFFLPSHIYTTHLQIGEEFAASYFTGIRSMESVRKLILIVCFAIGGVLFALGISACIVIFIRASSEETIPDEDERIHSLVGKGVNDTDDGITTIQETQDD